jgi:hypothetical protein
MSAAGDGVERRRVTMAEVQGDVEGRGAGAGPRQDERRDRLRIAKHVVGLTICLIAVVGLGRPGVALFSDEGAAVIQAQVLREHHTWYYESPLASIDVDGSSLPIPRATRGVEGLAPYGKHPLYPVLLAAVGPGSAWGALALSIAGTVVASVAAARLSRRCWPTVRCEVVVLWVTGLLTPLAFDSGLALAHTLGAALVAVALLAAAGTVDGDRRWWRYAAVVVSLVLAGMLRTEALFAGPALAFGAVLVAKRMGSRPIWPLFAAALAGTAGAWFVDRAWAAQIVADPFPVPGSATSGWLADRISGAFTTLVDVSYSGGGLRDVLFPIALALLAVGAVHFRRTGRPSLVVVALSIWSIAVALRLLDGPYDPIPGLLLAAPFLVACVAVFPTSLKPGAASALCVSATVAVAAGILLTQYGIGGGYEWGGRYFAILIPAFSAIVVPPAAARVWSSPPRDRRALTALVVFVSLLTLALGVKVQEVGHSNTEALASAIGAVSRQEIDPTSQVEGLSVVVSDNRLIPQILYKDFDRYAWAVATRSLVPGVAERLGEGTSARSFVLVTPRADLVTELEEHGWTAGERRVGAGQLVVPMSR